MKFVEVGKADIKKLLSDFDDLGELIFFAQEKEGMANLSYKIDTTSGSFILRLAYRNTWSQVQGEVELLNNLKNIPTPRLLANNKGQYLFKFKNQPAIIYKYLPGRVIKNITAQHVNQIGKFLGQYHSQARFIKSSVGRYRFYECSENMIEKTQAKIIKKFNYHTQDIKYIISLIKKFRLPKILPSGAIHVDIRPGNIFYQKGKLSGVIDFDNFYYGPLVLDIANTIIWNCAREGFVNYNLTDKLLRGYEKNRKLTSKEKKYLWPALNFLFASHIYEDMYGSTFGYNSGKLPQSLIKWELKYLLPAQKKLLADQKKFDKLILKR